ncbi:SusC/RagA family TonB-linked outer membrane protein [Rufibacter soli]
MIPFLQPPPPRRLSLGKGILLGSCLLLMGPALQAAPANFNALVQQTGQQAKVPVKGKVIDPTDGTGMPGVTIFVNDQAVGMTNVDGTFSLSVESGATLSFTFIGYQQQRVVISKAEPNLTISLITDAKQLGEVVVTALGIEREEKALGYSVTTVTGNQIAESMPNNWTDALSGKVAGLNLVKSGGGPAGSTKIVLRGETSLGGDNAALIVVDGVVMSGSSGKQTGNGNSSYMSADSPVDFGSSLSDINPEDIESVSVLKGPGAAALYGARGANGAIVITTKKGASKQKGMGITFNSNTTLATVNRWPDYQNEYGQGAAGQDLYYSYGNTEDGASTLSTSSAWGPKFNGQSYYQYDPNNYRVAPTERTPWKAYPNNRKDFFETAKTFTNSLTLSGGTDNTTARLSFTNSQNTWIVPNTGYDRNTVALQLNHKVNDKLSIATKVNYTNRSSDNLPTTGYNNQTIMYFIRGLTPNMDINWFKDYWLPGKEGIEQLKPFSNLLDNPYLQAYEMLNKSKRNTFVGNISATYNFTKDLSLMVRSSTDFMTEARSQQRPKNSNKFTEGMYREQDIYTQEQNSDFLLRYDHNRNSDFEYSVSFGGSTMKNTYILDEYRADKLLYPGIYSLANSMINVEPRPRRARYGVNSFYGLATIGYKDFLFLDVTARNDWTSTLVTPQSVSGRKSDNPSFFYPSFNLSALVSEMVELPSQVSLLKLRGSWAKVGSGGTEPYRTSYAYSPAINFASGLRNPTTLANPDLKPLTTTSLEFGLDLRLFKSRIGLDLSVYKNNTYDQIVEPPIDPASGYAAMIINAGEVENKGIEIQVNGAPFKSKDGFSWNVFGTFAANKNTVVSLPDSLQSMVLSTVFGSRGTVEARVGQRLGDMYGLGYKRSPEGQIIYDKGYPVLGDELIYLGNYAPKWKGSIGNEFKYNKFRMNVLFDGQFGGVGYSLTHAVLMEEGKLKKSLPGRYNGIIGEGVIANGDGSYRPNDVVADNIRDYYFTHFNRDNLESNVFSTDYIKLREVRLDYDIPTSYLSKLKILKASVGIYGRDLLVFSEWPAFDPEFGTLGDGDISSGSEIAQFPSTRTFGLNLTVGF